MKYSVVLLLSSLFCVGSCVQALSASNLISSTIDWRAEAPIILFNDTTIKLQVAEGGHVLFGDTVAGTGSKLIWNADKNAFRAGRALTTRWDPDSLGLYSAAFGIGTEARGNSTFAAGTQTIAKTFGGVAIGLYNTGMSGNRVSWNGDDPVLEVGNGTSSVDRRNAMTILKNGNIGVNEDSPNYKFEILNNTTPRTIYIDHNITSGFLIQRGIYVDADNTSSNSGSSYAGYFSMFNENNDAYGLYASGRTDATGSDPSYGLRAFADNDFGSGKTYAIYGSVSSSSSSSGNKFAGYFDAGDSDPGVKYGGYFDAGGGNGTKYAGYFTGDVYCTGSYLPSDQLLKKGIGDATEVLDRIKLLKVRTYQYDTETFSDMNLPHGERTGFLAREIAVVFPDLVKVMVQPKNHPEDGEEMSPQQDIKFKGINYDGLIPYLVRAVQEQQTQIDILRRENDVLKRENEKYEQLEKRIIELTEIVKESR